MNNLTNIFDSHAHYNDKKFDLNRNELLRSFPQNGINKIINVGASIKESLESIELAKNYDFIFAAVGVHPYEAENLSKTYQDKTYQDKTYQDKTYLEYLENFSKQNKVVAIGEIGLDYHYPNISKEIQKKVFKEQLSLASELNMPVIIHSREADFDVINILKQFKLNGVVHCFSSSSEIAEILINMGYYLGFTGVITFKNNTKQLKTLSVVPLDKILIETDCPYMAPEPYRGSICNSLMLPSIIKKIADLKNMSCQKIADITNLNACRLFNVR